jgi:hypothetical protein
MQFESAEKIDCQIFNSPKSAVLLIAGQSNAANYVEKRGLNKFGDKIFNYFNGECASAKDPLMGADGDLGSTWIRLANRLIESNKFDRILLVPVALGGTSMIRWDINGDLNKVLEDQFSRLKSEKISVSHFLWVQGEADRDKSSRYQKDLRVKYFDALVSLNHMSKNYFNSSAMYIVITSRCKKLEKPAEHIRWAQTEFVHTYSNPSVNQGPDLDLIIGKLYRNDNCHLTDFGSDRFANEWFSIIAK